MADDAHPVVVYFIEDWYNDDRLTLQQDITWLRDQLGSYFDAGNDVEIEVGPRLPKSQYELKATIHVRADTATNAHAYVLDKLARRGIINYRIGETK